MVFGQDEAGVQVAGVDGMRGGWVAVELTGGSFTSALTLEPVAADFAALDAAVVVAIDVPIGFGPGRVADAAARKLLPGAASTVFPTPAREILEQRFRAGLGVSAQSHALGPRIVHVTELAATDHRFHEVHPEVSFRAMNDGRPLEFRKKTAGGVLERVELLRRAGIELGSLGPAALAPIDDLLDAAACAWTAHRIACGRATSLPDPPETVAGRPVAIWY